MFLLILIVFFFFFFNDTATTEIYTLSLHDALPIRSETSRPRPRRAAPGADRGGGGRGRTLARSSRRRRAPRGGGRRPRRRRGCEMPRRSSRTAAPVCRGTEAR